MGSTSVNIYVCTNAYPNVKDDGWLRMMVGGLVVVRNYVTSVGRYTSIFSDLRYLT